MMTPRGNGYRIVAPRYELTRDQLVALVQELETALNGAVWVTNREERLVRRALNLTPSQTTLVVGLYKAHRHGGLTCNELEALLPEDGPRSHKRKDPEMRDPNTIKVFIFNLKRRQPLLLAPTKRGIGATWRLSEAGYSTVDAVLNPTNHKG